MVECAQFLGLNLGSGINSAYGFGKDTSSDIYHNLNASSSGCVDSTVSFGKGSKGYLGSVCPGKEWNSCGGRKVVSKLPLELQAFVLGMLSCEEQAKFHVSFHSPSDQAGVHYHQKDLDRQRKVFMCLDSAREMQVFDSFYLFLREEVGFSKRSAFEKTVDVMVGVYMGYLKGLASLLKQCKWFSRCGKMAKKAFERLSPQERIDLQRFRGLLDHPKKVSHMSIESQVDVLSDSPVWFQLKVHECQSWVVGSELLFDQIKKGDVRRVSRVLERKGDVSVFFETCPGFLDKIVSLAYMHLSEKKLKDAYKLVCGCMDLVDVTVTRSDPLVYSFLRQLSRVMHHIGVGYRGMGRAGLAKKIFDQSRTLVPCV